MRRARPGISVLLGVTYVLIVVAVLTIITLSVTAYLGNYFLSVRLKEQRKALESCAAELLPYAESSDPDTLYTILSAHATACNGRLLLLNEQGRTQVDTFCRLNGTVPRAPEIERVLTGQTDADVGYHHLTLSDSYMTKNNDYLPSAGSCWTAYYTQALVSSSAGSGGVLVLAAPVQDIVDQVSSVTRWIVLFSVLFTALVALITFYVGHSMTLSIRRFNRAIAKMSAGDFSVRVSENEIAEFGDLAKAFNMMSEKLENLDASRSQFVSDASHELKTPLASMKILSESLLTQEDAPVELYREFMSDINSEVDRLSLVINDLLTLVKTEKDTEALMLTSVELGALIRSIVDTVKPLARRKHITVSYEYRDVCVRADELRMQQLFTNLIDNAIKYSPENTTVTVTLSASVNHAVVTVADQGIGIAPEHLPHLFERFYRVDKARSRQAGGTGLGLAIVKQIVDQHAGTIEVKSELKKGTVFTVTLPLDSGKELIP